MRIRNVKNKYEILKKSMYVIKDPLKYKDNWWKLFNNNNPIHLEIGCGKCGFLVESAKRNPNINFIGIEKNASVITYGLKKLKEDLSNLYILNIDALKIDNIFDKEISKIYLNFSDPWPKKRHEKRRLTSEIYLKKYDKVLKNNGFIVQKTDNTNLFQYSLINYSKFGYKIVDISLDLSFKDEKTNIKTEYEEKFVNKGNKIYMVIVCK